MEHLYQLFEEYSEANTAEKLHNISDLIHELKDSSPDDVVIGSLHLARDKDQVVGIRQTSLYYLSQWLSKNDNSAWDDLNNSSREEIKQGLLEFASEVSNKVISIQLATTIAHLARSAFAEGEWDDLFPFLGSFAQEDDVVPQRMAMLILAAGAATFVRALEEDIHYVADLIHPLISSKDSNVCESAISAYANVVTLIINPETVSHFDEGYLACIQSLGDLIEAEKYESATHVMKYLISLATKHPRYAKENINVLTDLMLSVVNADVYEELRMICLEYMCTLCESLPTEIKKVPDFISNLVQQCVLLASTFEEIEGFEDFARSDPVDAEGFPLAIQAIEVLDRISPYVADVEYLEMILALFTEMAQSEDWNDRLAVADALTVVFEGIVDFITPQTLLQIVELACNLANDSHVQVQWSGLNCIGEFPLRLHFRINDVALQLLEFLFEFALEEHANRIMAQAVNSIAAIIRLVDFEIAQEVIEQVLQVFISNIQSGFDDTRNDVVLMLSCACSEFPSLIEYQEIYDDIVPFLKEQIVIDHTKDSAVFRGRCFECLTLLGNCYEEKFAEDVPEIIEYLLELREFFNENEAEIEDFDIDLLDRSIVRICDAIKGEFASYYERIAAIWYPIIERRESMVVNNDFFGDLEDLELDDGIDGMVVDENSGPAFYGFHSVAFKEKCEAIRNISCCCKFMGAESIQFLEKILDLFEEKIDYFKLEVAIAAIGGCRTVLELLMSLDMEDSTVSTLFTTTLHSVTNHILASLEKDTNIYAIQQYAANFKFLLDNVDVEYLDYDVIVRPVMGLCLEKFNFMLQHRETNMQDRENIVIGDEIEDYELTKALSELAEVFIIKLGADIEDLALALGKEFLAFISDENSMKHDRHYIFCYLLDCVEHIPEPSEEMFELLETMNSIFADVDLFEAVESDPDFAQTFIFSFGMFAEKQPNLLSGDRIKESMDNIVTFLNSEMADHPKNGQIYDNAVATLHRYQEFLDVDDETKEQLWEIVASSLPLKQDDLEAKVFYPKLMNDFDSLNDSLKKSIFIGLVQAADTDMYPYTEIYTPFLRKHADEFGSVIEDEKLMTKFERIITSDIRRIVLE
ncbi:hypothetical protein PCE1_001958 [Barthelona sp. PCE]